VKRKIILARVAGFCFGVRRAVDIALAERKLRTGAMVTLGPVVHNSQVTEWLSGEGIDQSNNIESIAPGSTVVMSAHGVSPLVRADAAVRGLAIVDVTCPFVTKVHRSALMLVEQGYHVLLVGDRGHTEVLGVVGAVRNAGGRVNVVTCVGDLDDIALGKKVGVISQTTQYASNLAAVVGAACLRCTEVRAVNTVCGATEELQEAALEMAKQVDIAIVVGGVKSANSRRLRELCASQGIPAYQVETADDIDPEWLTNATTIGLTAGASTPDWIIEAVACRLNGGELPSDWNLSHPDEK